MKKLLMLFGLCAIVSAASAQDSKFMAGGGLTYATDIDNIGINLKGLYLFNDTWEADGGFTYFFEKNNVKYSALDFNGHYVFMNNEGTCLYGLAGINITFYKIELGDAFNDALGDTYGDYYDGMDDYMPEYGASPFSDAEAKGNEVGFNLGAGGRMPLSEKLFLTGELKYTLGGADYLSLSAGIMYRF
jgi:opacity protein-like surface antigen